MTGSITSSTNCSCTAVHTTQIHGHGQYRYVDVNEVGFATANTLTCDAHEDYSYVIQCKSSMIDSGSSSTEILFIALSLFLFVVAVVLYVKLQRKGSNENQP